MKVICEKCRGRYRVPDSKLNKPVNRATCRNCGHRLLIPRPTGDEPAEGLLVQAVPATPGPAPGRPEPHGLGGPRAPRAPARTMPPSALSWEEAPATAITERRPPSQVSLHGSSAPRSTPLPAPEAQRGRTRTGSSRGHDPAGDMGWAMFGTAATLIGAVLLAALSVFDHDALMWLGLAFAFGGSVLALTMIVTGERGRQPARRTLSLALGAASALLLPSAVVGAKVGVEQVLGADLRVVAEGIVQAAPPVPQPARDVPQLGEDGGLEPQVGVGGPELQEVPGQEVPPAVALRREPAPSAGAARVPAAARQVAPAAAAAEPAEDPDAPSALHIQAVERLLRNNWGVKQCFVPLHRAGKLPRRVEVKFNILPDGTATGIQIESPVEHRESPLQKCMADAIPAITFPETSGKGTTITYPFILQMR